MKFYQKTWFVILMLIVFPPLGIFLLWKEKKFGKAVRIILTVVFAFYFLFYIIFYSAVADTETISPDVSTGENILMAAELQEAPVMNGFKTEQIGTWGYIELTSSEFNSLTYDDFAEFALAYLKDNSYGDGGYNWVSIISDDGTGAQWAGSIYTALTFGALDDEGCIVEETGLWEWDFDNDTYIEVDLSEASETATAKETGTTTTITTTTTTATKKAATTAAATKAATTSAKATTTVKDTTTYILNTGTGKFHTTSCYMVNQMNESNKKEVESSYDEMVSKGYSPCQKCLG